MGPVRAVKEPASIGSLSELGLAFEVISSHGCSFNYFTSISLQSDLPKELNFKAEDVTVDPTLKAMEILSRAVGPPCIA